MVLKYIYCATELTTRHLVMMNLSQMERIRLKKTLVQPISKVSCVLVISSCH